MSEQKKSESRQKKSKNEEVESGSESESDIIDLCDDHDYQVLAAIFETDSDEVLVSKRASWDTTRSSMV